MTPQDLRDALLAARQRHLPVAATAAHAAAVPDLDAACAVQQATGAALGAWAPDEMPRHWKSGGGSRSVALTHAPLLPLGVRHSAASLAAPLDDLHFFNPGLEGEIALRLARDVSPSLASELTHEGATSLIDAMAVSIEVVDCRWLDDGQLPPLLRLADFLSHGALALGEWRPWREVDWAQQACVLQVDDAAPWVRRGSHPLGQPAWLLPIWLRHLTRHGATVPAGSIVTTGSWTGLTPVRPGSTVRVSFEGIGQAALRL
jgi:hypothetical protein